MRGEVRRAGGRIAPAAVGVLIEAVGTDLRELAAATGQLVADTGGTIDEPAVRRYHRGRAETQPAHQTIERALKTEDQVVERHVPIL